MVLDINDEKLKALGTTLKNCHERLSECQGINIDTQMSAVANFATGVFMGFNDSPGRQAVRERIQGRTS